jgi:hypothetical protein
MCSASHTADVETIIHSSQTLCRVSLVMESMAVVIRVNGCKEIYILGWVVPCEIVCEMHVEQLLQTLSLLTAVGSHFQN